MENKILLKLSEDDTEVGYVYLPNHPGPGTPNIVHSQKRLLDLI